MHFRWIVLISLVLLSSLVSAQSPVVVSPISSPAPVHSFFDEIWDAIHALEEKVEKLIEKFQDFKVTVKGKIDDLNQSISMVSADLTATQLDLFDFETQTNASISDLHAVDENLQGQIDGIGAPSFVIDRSKLYEVINTNQSENTAFCEAKEDILLFGYCSIGPFGIDGPSSTLVLDDFSDLEYTTNPKWTPLSGSWGIDPDGGGQLMTTNPGADNLIRTPAAVDAMSISMEAKVTANGYKEQLILAISDSPTDMWNGYMVRLYVDGAQSYMDLWRTDLSNNTLLHSVNGFDLHTNSKYHMKASRDETGNWSLHLNGTLLAAGIVETTHTHFTDFLLLGYNATSSGSRFDDIKVFTPGDFNGTGSAIMNVSDLDSPLGVKCQNGGTARVLCLRQT